MILRDIGFCTSIPACTTLSKTSFRRCVMNRVRQKLRTTPRRSFSVVPALPILPMSWKGSWMSWKGSPVLDGVVCAAKFAEILVELGKSTSKYETYRFPEPKTYTGAFEHFGYRS